MRMKMELEQMTNQASQVLSRFDIDQNDLDDGDQTDTLGTIKSPHKHNYVQLRSSFAEGEELGQVEDSESDDEKELILLTHKTARKEEI